eukprot:TRINITY_DN54327_c0_g1_i1.p2 TRINITY_DN54327_c0_g1~~TRINITY_DN54327_c0_g1_i1.p2  ORF type:complete len:250 (-),score=56.74 TRINITY_DN54327_c0_g1_i1:62-709(-)
MKKTLFIILGFFSAVASGVHETAGDESMAPFDVAMSLDLDGIPGGPQDVVTVRVHPEWAPLGAKRFRELVDSKVLDGARFFRVVKDFMVQFGIPGDPEVAATWRSRKIQDDPVTMSNIRGRVTFATAGPGTRTTQLFINSEDNEFLDTQGFSPFAEVLGDGMKAVDKIQGKYGETPDQGLIEQDGNAYLAQHFPELSFLSKVEAVKSNFVRKQSL